MVAGGSGHGIPVQLDEAFRSGDAQRFWSYQISQDTGQFLDLGLRELAVVYPHIINLTVKMIAIALGIAANTQIILCIGIGRRDTATGHLGSIDKERGNMISIVICNK